MWCKVDDKMHSSPATMAAGNEAMGVWARAESYCADQGTDGYIPAAAVEMFCGSKKAAHRLSNRLTSAGLWENSDGGYRSTGFLQRNPSAADVRIDREAARLRMQRLRGGGHADVRPNNDGTLGEPPANFDRSSPSPYPTRPVPDPIPTETDRSRSLALATPARAPVRAGTNGPSRLTGFATRWGAATGILMDNGHELGLVVENIEGYAKAVARPFEAVSDEAIAAFRQESEGWTEPRPLTAKLFNAKWWEIQARMGGKVPKAKPAAARRRADEPPPRPSPPPARDVFVASFGEDEARRVFGT